MPNEVTSLDDITRALASRDASRPLYTFKVPTKLAAETGIASLACVELTPHEMMLAQKRGGADNNFAVGFELAKECLRRANGQRISTGDETADAFWSNNTPGFAKLRTLVTSAYSEIHNPKPKENEDFLASMSVNVG